MKVHDRIVFLDIDGVLQPGTQKRFDHPRDVPDLTRELEARCGGKYPYSRWCNTSEMDDMDLAAVFYDWDPDAVERLRYALDVLDARIVLSSNWREFHGFKSMSALFAIHGLDGYLCDGTASHERLRRCKTVRWDTPDEVREAVNQKQSLVREVSCKAKKDIQDGLRAAYLKSGGESSYIAYRTAEIREYLDRHPEVTSYVAIDDQDLTCGLDGHFVKTSRLIEPDSLELILDVLSRRDGPYPLPAVCLTEDVARMRRETIPLEEEEWFTFEPSKPAVRNRFRNA